MNRRDFLRLRTKGKKRIAELSCERLYMRYVDAQTSVTRRDEQSSADELVPWPWFGGEPPTVIREPTSEELFRDLERELSDADVVRVLDSDWLVSEEFRHEVEALLASFRARGGRVEFSRPTASSPGEAPKPRP